MLTGSHAFNTAKIKPLENFMLYGITEVLMSGRKVTVALRYTLSRFEVVGDSTELSSIQLSSTTPAQFTGPSSIQLLSSVEP